jgi:FAD/FMN-containing dehydrogenase
MDRRTFLHRASTTSAALGATALLGATAACSSTPHHSSAAGTTTTGSTPPRTTTSTTGGPPNWAALAGMLTGSLVLPADAAYAGDALLYNEVYPSAPAAIAYCATSTDVQRCVGFAREHGVALAARSGGHSYGGYSTSSGLVIDVSSLNDVVVGSASTQATVGAGAKLINIYNQLGSSGLLLPGGSCPTVGIAGLALGGGQGVFGRKFGLTCDSIASLNVVTADGSLRTCSPDANSDLYWACRGGGGGNFGVVTSFSFAVYPIPPVTLFTLEWPWGSAADVLSAWLQWTASAPQELWSNCQLLSSGSAGAGSPYSLKVTGVYAGSSSACSSALAPLTAAVGSATSYRFVGPESYLDAMLIEAGCQGKSVAQCQLTTPGGAGTLSRSAFVAKSSYINAPLPSAGVAAMVTAVQSLDADVPQVGGGIVFDAYGGKINETAAADTAFVHRDALACAQYSTSFGGAPSPSLMAAAHSWLAQTQTAFAPYAQGSYQNYIDPSLTNWAEAYYGSNLPRLKSVKQSVDPDDLFHFAQSIPLPT